MKYFIFLFLLIFTNPVQDLKVNEAIEFNAKILTYQRDGLVTKKALSKVLKEYSLEVLEHKGFDAEEVLFLKITHPSLVGAHINGYTRANDNFTKSEFILAFIHSTSTFYRLKGFETNDFTDLLGSIKTISLNKDLSIHSFKIQNKLEQNFYIDSLDLSCLFNYYRHGETEINQKCLESCYSKQQSSLKSH